MYCIISLVVLKASDILSEEIIDDTVHNENGKSDLFNNGNFTRLSIS